MLPSGPILKKVKSESLGAKSKKEEVKELVISATTAKEPPVTEDKIPLWAIHPHVLDKNMRPPTHPDYDPSTLYIPQGEKGKLTPTMSQFWDFKSENFDKVVLFKMGQFYEMFYEDAIVGNRYLDLNWNPRRFSTGFREKSFDEMASKLLNLGYKLAVVEQTETSEEMHKRIMETYPIPPKFVNRKLTQILTNGTWTGDLQDFDPKYLLVLIRKNKRIGFCFYEPSLLEVWYGSFDDETEQRPLRTLMWQTNPAEIIGNKDCEEYKRMFGTLPKKPLMTFFDLDCSFSEEKFGFPQEINEENVIIALKYLFSYFEKLVVLDNVKPNIVFKQYTELFQGKNFLGLDHQALRHLEIFYTNHYTKYSKKGSLFEFLDHTVSGFGHRLLYKWVANPSNNLQIIFSRLDAIEDLDKIKNIRDAFQNKLATFPDIERIFCKMYRYKNKTDIITHDDFPTSRFKNFKTILEYVRLAEALIADIQAKSSEFKSARLFNLVNYEDKGGILPNCRDQIDKILEMIDWNVAEPLPKKGVWEDYDAILIEIKQIEDELEEILQSVRDQFNDQTINYSHAKFPYQLEIQERLVKGKKKPVHYIFTSSCAGYQRFYTEEIKENIDKIENLKRSIQKTLLNFVKEIYKIFQENSNIWQRMIDILSELDCLCSFSKVSFDAWTSYSMSRPNFINSPVPHLNVKDMVHPCLVKNGVSFTPISIDFNTKKLDNPETILLTGPNMGGKSTTLRTLGVVAIMAHIGCYVPAQSCNLSLIDQIFTRMGSLETLCEGKSSFYIELEETLNILRNASNRSLALVDELGKGTSTFDGVAIAYAVLKNMVEEIACRGVFTTHYHLLTKEFEMDKRLDLYHTAFRIDPETGNVEFEYKLKEGACDKSHGILLAKSVFEKSGLPGTIVEQAELISADFEHCDERFTKVLNIIESGK